MMKDIMSKLANLEATAPKPKKMLTEDSTSPMITEPKARSLKDLFNEISETVAPGQKPLPVLDPNNKQAGMGFVTSNNPAVQNMLKNLDPKDVQIVQAPGQQPVGQQQQQQQGQPAPAGATGQPQVGQMQMKEKDEGKPGKNFAKIAKSAGKRYGSKEAGERVAGAVRAKLAKQGKLEEEQLDELSPETIKSAQAKRYGQLNQLAQTGAARAGSTTSFNAKASPQTINQFHDTETKAINRDFNDQQRTSAKYDPAERDAALASNERNRARNMSRGNMLNVANKKLQGTANVPAKSVAEGAGAKDWHDDMEQWALNKGLKNTGKKNSFQRAADRDNDWALSHRKSDTVKEESDAEKNAKETKKTFPNVKHLTKDGHPDWKKHGVKEGAKVDRMVKHIEKSERKLGKSKEKASDIAWATANKRGMLDNKNKKVKEGDIPSTQGIDTKGAGLGAGRSMTALEGKKPDFLDLDKDGNKKESMKKAAADKKKKKVDESMNHRISAARLEGKSHGLRGHAYHGKAYEDLDEMRAYHEGYKEGLDECYGQGVYENAPAATVPGMADQGMEEGNAFTAALAKTPKGGKFSVGGKTFTDRSNYDSKLGENDYAFESWDNQLNDLLNEGLSVSVSKGQQNSPDSVTITAQDAEADQLLQLVKHAGLGLFGDEAAHEPSSAMSLQPAHGGAPDEVGAGGVDIDVVDGNDGMMGLMQKLSGIQADGEGDEDYADEEGAEDCGCDDEETNEATCNECGMMEGMHESGCSMNKEMVDEVESEDQMEFEVSENAPDTGAADSTADEDAEAKEDAALAGEKEEEMNESFFNLLKKFDRLAESKEEDDEDEEDVTESSEEDEEDEEDVTEDLTEWANQVGKGPGKGSDAQFTQDIEFMTKVIAGGLNKPKSTGQTTAPIIAGQEDRMHDNPKDWATLAGIKK